MSKDYENIFTTIDTLKRRESLIRKVAEFSKDEVVRSMILDSLEKLYDVYEIEDIDFQVNQEQYFGYLENYITTRLSWMMIATNVFSGAPESQSKEISYTLSVVVFAILTMAIGYDVLESDQLPLLYGFFGLMYGMAYVRMRRIIFQQLADKLAVEFQDLSIQILAASREENVNWTGVWGAFFESNDVVLGSSDDELPKDDDGDDWSDPDNDYGAIAWK